MARALPRIVRALPRMARALPRMARALPRLRLCARGRAECGGGVVCVCKREEPLERRVHRRHLERRA
eukprot:3300240-Pleurochrysis_carterae.AAC.1